MYDRNGVKRSRFYKPYFRMNGKIEEESIADRFGPDVLADFMVDFMKRKKDGPFLVYYPALLVHTPWIRVPGGPKTTASPISKQKGGPECFPEMVEYLDKNVGRLVNAVDELGLSDNTLVVFTADHGDWLGDHGLILKGPMLYEGLLRVGCIARGPGVPAGATIDEPVSTIDLAPTFYDYCGVAPAMEQHGQSLRPLLEGGAQIRDFAYCEWDLRPSRSGVDLRLRTVRTKTAKLTLEENSGEGEMYDLSNDPHEMDNLFGDSGYAALQKELTDMVRARPDDMTEPKTPVGMA